MQDHRGKPFGPDHHPHRFKMAGKSLAGGHVGAYSETRGDWKYLMEMLFLSSYYGCSAICHLCRAHKRIKRLWYTKWGRLAQHRNTCHTNAQFCAWYHSRPTTERPPMLEVEGFDIWRTWVDWMHSCDLGFLAVAIPSAMWELSDRYKQAWPGARRSQRLDAAWKDYSKWCRDNQVKNRAFRFTEQRFPRPP